MLHLGNYLYRMKLRCCPLLNVWRFTGILYGIFVGNPLQAVKKVGLKEDFIYLLLVYQRILIFSSYEAAYVFLVVLNLILGE